MTEFFRELIQLKAAEWAFFLRWWPAQVGVEAVLVLAYVVAVCRATREKAKK